MKIQIAQVKKIMKDLKLKKIVIFGISEDDDEHVATHGKTTIDAQEAAESGNRLKELLGWPKEYCESKTLERKCVNCSFWKRELCFFDPFAINRTKEDRACHNFEPNV